MNKFEIIVLCVLVILTTTFKFAAGPAFINYLVVGTICISPLALLIKQCRVAMPNIDYPLAAFVILMMFSVLVVNPEYIRWSTVLFSIGFCFFFAILARLIKFSNISAETLSLFIKSMIYCYFIGILIQQLSTLFDLPFIPNKTYNFLNKWKLNSLASEPAHVAFTVGIYMIFYAMIQQYIHPGQSLIQNIRKNILLWIAVCWTMISTQTASASVMIILILLPWLTKNNLFPSLLTIGAIIVLAYVALSINPIPQPQRAIDSISSIITLDDKKIEDADLSASFRIIPAVRCLKALDIREKEFWVGHGVDADTIDFENFSYKIKPEKTEAYLFHIWYNYGLLTFFPLLWLVVSICFISNKYITWVITAGQFLLAAYVNSTPIWTILALMLLYRIATKQDTSMLKTYPL